MSTWVLVTALPPTKGHLGLMRFANKTADYTYTIICTQPDEPFVKERHLALSDTARLLAGYRHGVIHYDKKIQQVPKDDNDTAFWDMWKKILFDYGCVKGDNIVVSEMYGAKLAEIMECTFIPYDIPRTMNSARATDVRTDPIGNFSMILPEFQGYLRKRVTVFGAESCGKTTLSQQLAEELDSLWLPEYARPYLEAVGPDVTNEKMGVIHQGQRALQLSADGTDYPFIIQDTDLFSTLGYWHLWNEGPPNLKLMNDAVADKSDLYIVCPSNIPFEEDPLRYGGKERESSDDYWISLCENFGLNYKVLTTESEEDRLAEAKDLLVELFNPDQLKYERVV